MSSKPQKRSRESSGIASSSATEATHPKENGTEGRLTPPPKRVRHNGLARNDAEMDDTVVDMELDNNRNIATGPSKSGTATAGGGQPTSKRSRKTKGDTASTAGVTPTVPAPATAPSKPASTRPATDSGHRHIPQRYPSAAKVVEASSISAGRVRAPNNVREGGKGLLLGTRKPPVTPAHSEGGGHPRDTTDSGTEAGSRAGSGPSLLNGSKAKSKTKVQASKAQGREDAEGATTGQTLSMSMSVAVGTESPVRGVTPSRLRRIAESADDSPNDSDIVGGKSSVQSSAVEMEKDGGDQGQVEDWADRFLWKVLPALGGCPAIGVLHNLTYKGMMLLMLVLWYWIMWSFAVLMTGALKDSIASNGGGVQEGVSQRSVALSLLNETDEYQSLKRVLESRRREMIDLWAMGEASWSNLRSLGERTGTMGRNIQVLREQAKNTADSRGLPQQPEAMQEIAKSQLSEVEAMLWHLKEAHFATSGIIAAGQKWTEDAERDLEKDKWRLQRAASAAWEIEIDPFLMSVYQEVGAVAEAADVLMGHMMRKASTEDVEGYIQMIEDGHKATITSRRRSEEVYLQQRVEAIVVRESEREWPMFEGEYTSKGYEATVALKWPLLTTVDEMKHLVDREIEISASGGTGLRNYASLVGGASIVHGNDLTSPSMTSVDHGWWSYAAKLFGARIGSMSPQTAEAALSTSNTPGHCFAFRGGQGKLTVKLGKPGLLEGGHTEGLVKVTHISIEHAPLANLPAAAQSAPQVFVVLGWDADPTASSSQSQPHVLVGPAEFSVEHDSPSVQTFKVLSAARHPPVGWVTLEVESNHGGDWTCLYGFRVHGE